MLNWHNQSIRLCGIKDWCHSILFSPKNMVTNLMFLHGTRSECDKFTPRVRLVTWNPLLAWVSGHTARVNTSYSDEAHWSLFNLFNRESIICLVWPAHLCCYLVLGPHTYSSHKPRNYVIVSPACYTRIRDQWENATLSIYSESHELWVVWKRTLLYFNCSFPSLVGYKIRDRETSWLYLALD